METKAGRCCAVTYNFLGAVSLSDVQRLPIAMQARSSFKACPDCIVYKINIVEYKSQCYIIQVESRQLKCAPSFHQVNVIACGMVTGGDTADVNAAV